MSVMVLDAGNSIIKAKIARRENGEIAFSHAMRQLTESENMPVGDTYFLGQKTKKGAWMVVAEVTI